MRTLTLDTILVALKDTLSTPKVDGRHIVFQVLGSFGSYRDLSTLKVVGILVAMKATVDMNAYSRRWQDFGSFEKLHCQLR